MTTTAYVGNIEEVSTTGSSTTTVANYYFNGVKIALANNGTFSFLGNDPVGIPLESLGSTGALQADQLFVPYGERRYNFNGMPDGYKWAKQNDDNTGLYYDAARYYDPVAAQFISADSMLPGNGYDTWGLSRYAYVEGNPISFADPSGHAGTGTGTYNILQEAVQVVQNAWNSAGDDVGPLVGAEEKGGIFEFDPAAAIATGIMAGLQPSDLGNSDCSGYCRSTVAAPPASGTVYGGQTVAAPPASGTVGGTYHRRTPLRAKTGGGNPPKPPKKPPTSAGGIFDDPEENNGDSIQWNPVNGPGPLGGEDPDDPANTFRSGTYWEIKLQEDTILYRSWGGGVQNELGHFWNRVPLGPTQSIVDNAINPLWGDTWGNTAVNSTRILVPSGTTIYEGIAAPQGGLVGGGTQIYIPEVNPGWILP